MHVDPSRIGFHMYLANLLKDKTLEELKNFARFNEIKGYVGLKKADLQTLILTSVAEVNQLKEMFTRLPPSAKWILMVLAVDFNGTSLLDALETKVQELYSRMAFRKIIGTLLDSPFFNVTFNEHDQEYGIIPDDIQSDLLPFVLMYKYRNRKTIDTKPDLSEVTPEEIASDTEEKENVTGILLEIPDMLWPVVDIMNYPPKNTLKFYCEQHGLIKEGQRQQLIERILKSNPPFDQLLDAMFHTPELQLIAKDLDLPKSSHKNILISTILTEFGLSSHNYN